MRWFPCARECAADGCFCGSVGEEDRFIFRRSLVEFVGENRAWVLCGRRWIGIRINGHLVCRVAIAVVNDDTGEEVALLCVALKAQLAGEFPWLGLVDAAAEFPPAGSSMRAAPGWLPSSPIPVRRARLSKEAGRTCRVCQSTVCYTLRPATSASATCRRSKLTKSVTFNCRAQATCRISKVRQPSFCVSFESRLKSVSNELRSISGTK
jgi:hypothetical protein